MAELLSAEDVETALASLPGWTYDGTALVREVVVPDTDQKLLVDRVMTEADRVNHHPVIDRQDDRMAFRVWTHSAGGVTAKDVDLATRIDRELSAPPR